MKFSLKTYERLIELVRDRPALYDASLSDYKDLSVHKDCWKDIAHILNEKTMGWEDWKKVWKQKRDEYTRKRRELANYPSGLDTTKPVKKGPLFDKFAFLSDHVGRSDSRGSFSEGNESFKKELQETEQMEDASEPEMPRSPVSRPASRSSSPPFVMGRVANISTLKGTFCNKNNNTNFVSSLQEVSCCDNSRKTTQKVTKTVCERNDENTYHQLADILHCLSQTSCMIETLLRKISEDNDKGNIFTFLAKRTKNFSESTQQWLEDEALKLYMEAKRRDKMDTERKIHVH